VGQGDISTLLLIASSLASSTHSIHHLPSTWGFKWVFSHAPWKDDVPQNRTDSSAGQRCKGGKSEQVRELEQGGEEMALPYLAERMMTRASSSLASSSSDVTFLVPGSN